MAIDDLDRNFENALANRLRFRAPEDSLAQNPACPDPEVLAAYHERSLSLVELPPWKSHIAGCPRCQDILAQLELTDNLSVATKPGEFAEKSLVIARGVALPGAASQTALDAAPARFHTAATQAQPARVPVVTLRPRKTLLPWIAPAGAIAAGLLVWLAIHEKSSVPSLQSSHSEIALNREPIPSSAPAPSASLAKTLPAPSEAKKKESTPSHQVSPTARYAAGSFSNSPAKPAAKKDAAPLPEAPALTSDATSVSGSTEQGAVAGALKQSGAPRPPWQAGTPMTANGALAGKALAERAKSSSPSAAAAPTPSAVAQSRQPVDETIAASTQTVEVTSAAPLQSPMLTTTRSSPYLRWISAPDGRTVWMVGPSGFLQRSEDAGKTWRLQKSHVTSDLRAGSAPTFKICWVVGNAGVVLRTTDGGKNWSKLTSPMEADLGAVIASDALHATVTDTSHKTSFVTEDGGATWTPVASE